MIIGMKLKKNHRFLPGYLNAVYVGMMALQAPIAILTIFSKKISSIMHEKLSRNSPIIANEIVNHKLSARAKLIKTQATPLD